jgi:hypothetical protein
MYSQIKSIKWARYGNPRTPASRATCTAKSPLCGGLGEGLNLAEGAGTAVARVWGSLKVRIGRLQFWTSSLMYVFSMGWWDLRLVSLEAVGPCGNFTCVIVASCQFELGFVGNALSCDAIHHPTQNIACCVLSWRDTKRLQSIVGATPRGYSQ